MHYTLTLPSGQVHGSSSLDNTLDFLRRLLDRDGLPTEGRYLVHERWTADGRFGTTGPMQRLVLGVDNDGPFSLDGSGIPVPTTI